MASIYDWSVEADKNGASDALIEWRENQRPKTVNNSGRMMMRRLREYVTDNSVENEAIMLVSQEPKTAIQVKISSDITEYVNDLVIKFSLKYYLDRSESAGITILGINNLEPKPVFAATRKGVKQLTGGEFAYGGSYTVVYKADGQNIGWHLLNPSVNPAEFYDENEFRAPPGIIMPFAFDSVPKEWLLCDGQAYDRLDYPGLFAAIGTTWGKGTDKDSFRVPDLRGLFLRSRSDNQALGEYQWDSLASHQVQLETDELIIDEPKPEPPKPKPKPPAPPPPRPRPRPRPLPPLPPIRPLPPPPPAPDPYDVPARYPDSLWQEIIAWSSHNRFLFLRNLYVDETREKLRRLLKNYYYPQDLPDKLERFSRMLSPERVTLKDGVYGLVFLKDRRELHSMLNQLVPKPREREEEGWSWEWGKYLIPAWWIMRGLGFEEDDKRKRRSVEEFLSRQRRQRLMMMTTESIKNDLRSKIRRGQYLAVLTHDENPYRDYYPNMNRWSPNRTGQLESAFVYGATMHNIMTGGGWYRILNNNESILAGWTNERARYPLYTNSVFYFDSDGYLVNPNGGWRIPVRGNTVQLNYAAAQARDYTQVVLGLETGLHAVFDGRYYQACNASEHLAPYAYVQYENVNYAPSGVCARRARERREKEQAEREKREREQREREQRERAAKEAKEKKERDAAAAKAAKEAKKKKDREDAVAVIKDKLEYVVGSDKHRLIVTPEENPFADKSPDMAQFTKADDDGENDKKYLYDAAMHASDRTRTLGMSINTEAATYPLYTNSMYYFDSEGYRVNPNGGWRSDKTPSPKALAQAKDYTERELGKVGGLSAVYDSRYRIACTKDQMKAPYGYVKLHDETADCSGKQEADGIEFTQEQLQAKREQDLARAQREREEAEKAKQEREKQAREEQDKLDRERIHNRLEWFEQQREKLESSTKLTPWQIEQGLRGIWCEKHEEFIYDAEWPTTKIETKLASVVKAGERYLVVMPDKDPFSGREPDFEKWKHDPDEEGSLCDETMFYDEEDSEARKDIGYESWLLAFAFAHLDNNVGDVAAKYPLYTNGVAYFDSDKYRVNPNFGARYKDYECEAAFEQAKDFTERVLGHQGGYHAVYDARYGMPEDASGHKAPYEYIPFTNIAKLKRDYRQAIQECELSLAREAGNIPPDGYTPKVQPSTKEEGEALMNELYGLQSKLQKRVGKGKRVLVVHELKNPFWYQKPDMEKFKKDVSADGECDQKALFDDKIKRNMEKDWSSGILFYSGTTAAKYPLYTNSLYYFDSEGYRVNPNGGWRISRYEKDACVKALAQAKDYTERIMGHAGGYDAVFDSRYSVPCKVVDNKAPYDYVKLPDYKSMCRSQEEEPAPKPAEPTPEELEAQRKAEQAEKEKAERERHAEIERQEQELFDALHALREEAQKEYDRQMREHEEKLARERAAALAEAERLRQIEEERRRQEELERQRQEAERQRLEELERQHQAELERKRQEELRRQQEYEEFVNALRAETQHTHNIKMKDIGGVETRPINVSVVYAIRV